MRRANARLLPWIEKPGPGCEGLAACVGVRQRVDEVDRRQRIALAQLEQLGDTFIGYPRAHHHQRAGALAQMRLWPPARSASPCCGPPARCGAGPLASIRPASQRPAASHAERRARRCGRGAGRSTASTAAAVVRQVAALQDPHAVVVQRAVHERHARQRWGRAACRRCRRRRCGRRGRCSCGGPPPRPPRGGRPLGAARTGVSVGLISFLRGLERTAEVVDQVVGIFQADRQADRARADAGLARAPHRPCGSVWSMRGGSPASGSRPRWPGAKDLQQLR